eukprot:g10168.t1
MARFQDGELVQQARESGGPNSPQPGGRCFGRDQAKSSHEDPETLQDPTNWIIAEARKRRQANEQPKGKGDGKGEEKDSKINHKNDGKTEKPQDVPEWRSQDANDKNAKGANKGTGKGKAEEPEEETDQFRAKMKRTINWYNRHGHLCAPIRFQEVITTLGSTDPRVAMRTAFATSKDGRFPDQVEGCFPLRIQPCINETLHLQPEGSKAHRRDGWMIWMSAGFIL